MRLAMFFFALSLTACESELAEGIKEINLKEKTVVQPIHRKSYAEEDWNKDFESVINLRDKSTNSDGVSEYKACFGNCTNYFYGMRDEFRKVNHLTLPLTKSVKYITMYNSSEDYPRVLIDMRIVAPVCKEAIVALNPILIGKEWLFMNKLAFMADGEVVYEENANDLHRPKRDIDDGKVIEDWVFILDGLDYEKINKFTKSKNKIIRVTGEKGYVTLSKNVVDTFSQDIEDSIEAAKIINSKLKEGGGPNCIN